MNAMFWVEKEAEKVMKHSGNKSEYVCAAGITPSGTVHIGNFREIITVDLIVKALQNRGKKVAFLYFWDDFDRLRKVPQNLPAGVRKELEDHIGEPVAEVPDPLKCHESYAKHWQTPLEEAVEELGIKPKFIYQHELYRKCAYSEGIKTALTRREDVRVILNKYRKEPRPVDWFPVKIYCEKCNKDSTKITNYDENYEISYECLTCDFKNTIDFRKVGIIKLVWRVDWPMRWKHYGVDFEPGGKEHFAAGSSRTTGVEIVKQVYNGQEPYGFMYEFISLKGFKGKMSGSKGNVLSVNQVSSVYLPEIVRFLFAGTKPSKDFSISLDDDVLKVYDDFYKAERVFFNKERMNKRDTAHWKKVYEYSMKGLETPQQPPIQPPFRLLSDTYQTFGSVEKAYEKLEEMAVTSFDKKRLLQGLKCAKSWVEEWAPQSYVHKLTQPPRTIINSLTEKERTALLEFADLIEKTKTEKGVKLACQTVFTKHNIEMKRFFQLCYLIMFAKPRGPRLAEYVAHHDPTKISEHIKKTLQ